jgi:hypothetical protein
MIAICHIVIGTETKSVFSPPKGFSPVSCSFASIATAFDGPIIRHGLSATRTLYSGQKQ